MVDFLNVQATPSFFSFNITAAVGPREQNRLEDVELVRFGYKMKRINPNAQPNLELNSLIDKMSGKGVFGADLQQVIVLHQRIKGGTQDARVSRALSFRANGQYDGANMWVIEVLSNNMRAAATDIFPRLDLHDQCGPELRKAVRRIFLNEA